MCGVSLSDEYWLAHTQLGFARADIDRMILNGFESAFLPWPERQRLIESVREELRDLDAGRQTPDRRQTSDASTRLRARD
jgi:adenosine deaminase